MSEDMLVKGLYGPCRGVMTKLFPTRHRRTDWSRALEMQSWAVSTIGQKRLRVFWISIAQLDWSGCRRRRESSSLGVVIDSSSRILENEVGLREPQHKGHVQGTKKQGNLDTTNKWNNVA